MSPLTGRQVPTAEASKQVAVMEGEVASAMRAADMRRGSRAQGRRSSIGWDSLTPAELQIARLTVEGLTNPKMAERLYVSKYTVQTHLSNIFSKLQISSRAELAAVTARQQANV